MSKKKKFRQNQNNIRQGSVVPIKNNPSQIALQAYNEGQAAVRSIDKRLMNSVPKGFQYDWLNNVQYNNIVYPIDKIPDRMLRLCERRNPIVGAAITLRIQEGVEFSHISHDGDVPGWEFTPTDDKITVTPEMEKQKEFLEHLIQYGCTEDYTSFNLTDKPPTFKDRLTRYMRDRLTIDKVVWEVERDRKGRTVALWVLDGATVFPVLPGGFYGSTSQISAGMQVGFNQLNEKIRQARIDKVPPVELIAYVQELLYGMSGGGITAAFEKNDIIFDISNELNDVRYYKQGFSVVEKANLAVTAFINAISYNSNGLSRGAIPKVGIAMGKDAGYTQEQLEDLQDEWMANFEGVDGQWNMPLLNGDAKVLQLLPNNRDMEYQVFLEFMGALICSEMGVDPAEMGLRLNQAQNVLSENNDAKMIFSKARGLRDLLGGFAYIINDWIEISGYEFAKNWRFGFNGLNTEDKGFEADLRRKAIETDMTINESRKLRGEKPDPYGDIICNPQYVQYRIQKEQQESMSQQNDGGEVEGDQTAENEEFDDNDVNEIVDEAIDENNMQKAIILI
jgi:hypothetical protein